MFNVDQDPWCEFYRTSLFESNSQINFFPSQHWLLSREPSSLDNLKRQIVLVIRKDVKKGIFTKLKQKLDSVTQIKANPCGFGSTKLIWTQACVVSPCNGDRSNRRVGKGREKRGRGPNPLHQSVQLSLNPAGNQPNNARRLQETCHSQRQDLYEVRSN